MPFQTLKRQFFAAARNEDGAIAIMFGLSLIVLVLMAGIAIDSSRVVHTTYRVQSALDRAAIASAKKMDNEGITTSEIQTTADKYFNEQLASHLVDTVSFTNFTAIPDFNTGTVTVSVDINLPLYFAAIAKAATNKTKTMTSAATYKPKKLEIALVVDITGSMLGTKLDALKSAANDMVDNLYSANPSNGAVRFSLVPYSSSLNAGVYANVATNGTSIDNCVVERKGSKAYSNDPPGPGNYFEISSVADNPSYYCPANSIVPLQDISSLTARNAYKANIDALTASGGTAGHLGLAWGWYTVTPQWGSTLTGGYTPRAYDPSGVTKAVVFMTDGMLNTAYNNGGESYVWPDLATTDPTKPGSSAYQALQLCDAMRNPANANEKITVYTVAFQAPPDAETLLTQCSGAANFYKADTASDLTAAFKEIAEQLSKLRVTS